MTVEVIKEIVRIKQEITEERKNTVLGSTKIQSPEDAVRIASDMIGEDDREVLLVLVLNTANQVNAVYRCHVGSLNASVAHPREIMKAAILNNAASFILAHNHPSGRVVPSREDIDFTKRIREAGKLLGIELFDHLIVTDDESTFTSLRQKGYI